MKKIIALLVAIACMFTMMAVSVAAADGTLSVSTNPENIYKDSQFVLNVNVAGLETYFGLEVKITYDPEIIAPTKANGDVLTAWNAGVVATTRHPWFALQGKSLESGALSYCEAINTNSEAEDYSGETCISVSSEGFTAYGFNFKALKDGNANLAVEVIGAYKDAGAANKVTLDVTAPSLVVYSMPVAPTATSPAASTSAPVEAGTVAPTYTWNNGVTDTGADTTTGDASVVTWYAGEDKIGETVAKAEFTVPAKAVGKELSYTILPKVNRELVGEGTLSDKVVVGNVAAISSYKPAVTAVKLDNGAVNAGEILASTRVTAVPTTDTTYNENEVKTYTFAYEWYAVNFTADETKTANDAITAVEAYTADTETLVKLESTTATASFDAAEYKDWFAVVKVTPSVTIAGEAEARPGDAFCAAAKVTGEPPELADGAEAEIEKLAAKKLFTSSTADATDVEFVSNVVDGIENVDPEYIGYTYAWYLTDAAQTADNFNAESATAITAEDALKTPGKVKLSKVENAETKFLNVVITATDGLGIYSSVTVCFQNAIKKATGGSGTQGGASLVTGTQGGTVVEPEKPGTDEPAVDEKNPQDPAGEANDKGATVFTDVDKEAYAWAYEGIDALTKAGVIKGMTETTFGPELTATNAQMIALAVRIAGLTAEGATTDKVDAEHWVAAELAVADAKGILGVYGDKIDVEGATSREIAFTLLYNALKAAGVELAETAEAIEFTDAASIDANCVEAINALVKAGIVNGMGDGTLAPKATLTRAQLAKILGMANALVTK